MSKVVSLPAKIEIQPENIPQELKDIPRWLLWRWESKGDGKPTKPPYTVLGTHAKVNLPETWATFSVALNALTEVHTGKFHGLGLVLSDEDDLIAWDLDHCIERKTGELADWAEHIVSTLNSYTEVTPSGEGLRIFVRGKLTNSKGESIRGKKHGHVECYQTVRYITVTGFRYPDTTDVIGPSNNDLFIEQFEEKKKKKEKPSPSNQIELLQNGEWKEAGYPSQSEADLSYCKYLANTFRGNPERIDEEFRKSKLFRPKWDTVHSSEDGRTYGQLTITIALRTAERGERLTDLGNAKRFARLLNSEAKFSVGRWYIWDGKRFGEDHLQRIYLMTQRVIDELTQEVRSTVDDDDRKLIHKHMMMLEGRVRLESMIKLTEAQETVAIHPEILDANPYMINCENGILTQDGRLLEHDPIELITHLTNVRVVPRSKCERWQQFLDEVLPGKELQEYVQRAVGYSLTGLVTEQVLFFAYGTGQNGKSTFFHILEFILGDYFSTLPIEALMASKNEQHPTFLTDLRGARFVLASEPEDGRRFNESVLKQVTGGEKIVARRMHKDFERFTSTAKLWIMGNHKPAIRGTDLAIWRRFAMIPFNVIIPDEKKDKNLWPKLEDEAEGIFWWAYEGFQKWKKEGLNPPEIVLDSLADYKAEMDTIQEFLTEYVETVPGAWLLHSELYAVYSRVAISNNERVLSSKAFAKKMREKGHKDLRRTGNHLYWESIKIQGNDHQEEM